MSLYIGLMSGTSMDGVDGVLVDFPAEGPLSVVADAHMPMPAALAAELLALNTRGDDELQRAALAANALASLQSEVVAHLLDSSGTPSSEVRAVGSHGQTVRHRPGEFDATGFTIQLNNGALLAETCGIAVVCDFRSRDVAAGGQGAPLVPAFHQAVFGAVERRAVLNVGGIANLTLLGTRLGGFDCGPGNALMDHWCALHTGQPFDADGRWAASGRVDTALLADFPIAPADVQATLLELTASAAIDALLEHAPATRELLVCGGGALNGALMGRLAASWPMWPGLQVASTASAGLPPTQVEATAFAWLAKSFCERLPGNHPGVTGAAGLRVLGALYPA